jgi:hypothetical protein
MKKVIILAITLLPTIINAQTTERLGDLNDVAKKASSIGNLIMMLAISFAVLLIIISIVRYLIAGKDGEERAKGGQAILFGVIGLFAILSIWGLVGILQGTFKFTNDQKPSFDHLKIVDPTNPNSSTDRPYERWFY